MTEAGKINVIASDVSLMRFKEYTMKHKATHKIGTHPQLSCPVCEKRVSLASTRLEQMRVWLNTRHFQKTGDHMIEEALAGRFKEWACRNCESHKEALFPDYSKQNYGLGGPILFYNPKKMSCDTCKKEFIFEAADQKFWYEDLGFNYSSFTKNCYSCRKETRSQKLLHKKLAELLQADPKTAEQFEKLAEVYTKLGLNKKAENYLARARNKKR